jgi:iron complex transport system permease protein
MRKASIAVIGGLLVMLAAGSVLSMNLGKMALTPFEVFATLFGQGNAGNELVLFEFRLPRIALAVLVGFGMAASGTVLQGLLRNNLADPGILGISAGSGLVVLIVISVAGMGSLSSAVMLPLLAFIGGLFAALLIYLFSYSKGAFPSPTRLILTGVAINVGLGAASLFLTLKLDENQYAFAQKWQAGYLWGDKWIYISILAPWVLLLFGYIWYKSRTLNTIGMGYEVATGVGVSVNKAFVGLTLAAVAIASGSVALGGSIFFIGLISPHMARKLVGPDHRLLLPAAGLIGGIILLASDTIVRTASFVMGIPAGVIVTIVSVPYFLYLLMRAS